MKIEELALNEWSNLGYPVTADGIVKLCERFLAAYAQQQEPVGWIDGEGDPYCQHGWGKKPPEGWTTCEENSYPVFRHAAPVVPADMVLVPRELSDKTSDLLGDTYGHPPRGWKITYARILAMIAAGEKKS